jgi:hypothetical protein
MPPFVADEVRHVAAYVRNDAAAAARIADIGMRDKREIWFMHAHTLATTTMDTLRMMHSSLHRRSFLTSTAAVLALRVLPAQDTPAKVDIHVDPSRVLRPVANDFLGFGCEISSVAVQGLLSPRNNALV